MAFGDYVDGFKGVVNDLKGVGGVGGSTIDPTTGVGAFFIDYGIFLTIGVSMAAVAIVFLIWHANKMMGEEV